MLIPRVIPILLLRGTGIVKGKGFKNHQYIGDPLNAIHIFNTKEVDELAVFDVTATEQNRVISPTFVQHIASECMMPLMVGGGISSLEQAAALFHAGAEKVAVNSHWIKNPSLITDIAKRFGSQSIVVSLDAKKNWMGKYQCYSHAGRRCVKKSPIDLAKLAESLGAGEILINSIDRDGMMQGFDIDLISAINKVVDIPVIAAGGAGKLEHFQEAINKGGCAAVAAGSLFVFHGARRAVLISYPERGKIEALLSEHAKDKLAREAIHER